MKIILIIRRTFAVSASSIRHHLHRASECLDPGGYDEEDYELARRVINTAPKEPRS